MAVSDCAYDLIESTKRHATEDATIDVNKKVKTLFYFLFIPDFPAIINTFLIYTFFLFIRFTFE